jgi:preprotein translocase subunit SecA
MGSSIFYLSMEDDVVRLFGGDRMKKIAEFFRVDDDTPLTMGMLTRRIEGAQRRIEGRNFGIRKTVLEYDNVMNKQREIIYTQRNKVLTGESVTEEIMDMFSSAVEKVVNDYANPMVDYPEWDVAGFNMDIEKYLLPGETSFLTEDRLKKWDIDEIKEKLNEAMRTHYEKRRAEAAELKAPFDEIERTILLKVVDMKWMDHIDAMDVLRRGIGLRAYGNHDPVTAYKKEGFQMFEDMIERIREHTVQIMMRINFEAAPKREERKMPVLISTRGTVGSESKAMRQRQAVSEKTVGRNDPCPCNSGKKHKNCCGQ